MSKQRCLNCGTELTVTKGKKLKKYCNANCRQKHWQKTKNKDGKKDVIEVPVAEYEELKRIEVLYAKMIKTPDGKREGHFVVGIDPHYEAAQTKKPSEATVGRITSNSGDLVAEYKVRGKGNVKNEVAEITKGISKRHKLYKEGDPKEGSAGFFMKYGVSSYNEIK